MENERAKKYTRIRRVIAESNSVVTALLLVFMAADREDVFGKVAPHLPTNYYFGLFLFWGLVYAAMQFLTVPFAIAAWRLDRKYQLSRQSFFSWSFDYAKLRAMEFGLGSIAVLWAYVAINHSPGYWWLVCWGMLLLYQVAFTFFLPTLLLPLFAKVSTFPDGEIAERLYLLAWRTGLTSPRLGVIHVGSKTRRSNALVVGWGKTRRILVTDTLLESLTPEEIEAITAHEIGHAVLHHLPVRIFVLSALYLIAFGIGHLILASMVPAISDFGYLPGLILFFWLSKIYISIVFAALVRRQESSADLFCWKMIEDVQAYLSAMRKLHAQNLIGYNRGQQWIHTHPALESRIAAAEKFLVEKSAPPKTDVAGAS